MKTDPYSRDSSAAVQKRITMSYQLKHIQDGLTPMWTVDWGPFNKHAGVPLSTRALVTEKDYYLGFASEADAKEFASSYFKDEIAGEEHRMYVGEPKKI